jgi:predicted amidohydrolase
VPRTAKSSRRRWIAAVVLLVAVGVPLLWAAARRSAERVVRVGVVQLLGVEGSLDDNVARAETLIREAAAQGARYVVLPEVYGLFPAARAHRPVDEVRAEAQPIPGPLTDRLVALARALDVNLAVGMAERDGDALYNTVVLLEPTGVAGRYRKRALIDDANVRRAFARHAGVDPSALPPPDPNDARPDERATFAPGTSAVVVPWGGIRTGILICADGGFRGFWTRTLAEGAEMVVWPTSSSGFFTPNEPTPSERAATHGVPVVFANRARPDVGFGQSVIADRGAGFGDAVIVADVRLPPPSP